MVQGPQGVPVGLGGLVLLLVVLTATSGLGTAGWLVGLGCGTLVYATVARGSARCAHALGPADLVTLTRVTLGCGVAAVVADLLAQPRSPSVLAGLAASALVLDLVDGWVARRTRTASAFGARFDGEADAFLMLVLSVHVAASFGAWVLAIGGVRYVFGAAGIVLPWMREQLPPRYWRKVVAATAGTVLTVAAARLLPDAATRAALLLVLVLLAESFGRDVWWLARRGRPAGQAQPVYGGVAR